MNVPRRCLFVCMIVVISICIGLQLRLTPNSACRTIEPETIPHSTKGELSSELGFSKFIRTYVANKTSTQQKYFCPCCGSQHDFVQYSNRPHAMCPKCKSVERHRRVCALLGAGVQRSGKPWFPKQEPFAPPFRLVHFGPQNQMEKILNSYPGLDQVSLDKDVSRYSTHTMDADVLNIALPSGFASGIMIFHVLEHVPDLELAVQELVRILSKGGWMLVEVPCGHLPGGKHKDCRGNMTDAERKRCSYHEEHQWHLDCDAFGNETLGSQSSAIDCYRINPSDFGVFSSFTKDAGWLHHPLFACTKK